MKLADKPVYPIVESNWSVALHKGITYKEALVLALAGNPKITEGFYSRDQGMKLKADTQKLFDTADAIIKQMEKNENG